MTFIGTSEIPNTWKERRIAEIVTLHNGRAYKLTEWEKKGIPVIRIQNLSGGKDYYYSNLDLPDHQYVNKGDLLYAWSGHFGSYIWQGSKAIYHYHIWKVVPKSEVSQEFIYFYLDWITEAMKQYDKRGGLGLFHLTKAGIESFKVLIPDFYEQQRIAEILFSVNEAIACSQAVIDQIQMVKRGLMRQLLAKGLPGWHSEYGSELGGIPIDWDTKKIGDVSKLVTSGSRGWAQYYSSCGVAFIRITNLVRGSIHLDLRDLRKVAIPQKVEGQRAQTFANDLLFSITAEVGLVSLVPGDLGEAYINQHIALVRLNNHDFCPRFVAYWLLSQAGQEQFRRLNDAGAKAGLSLPSVRAIQLPKPSLDEQQKIAHILASVDESLQSEQDKKVQLEITKKGLMQQLLTGKRRVPVDAVEPAGGG